MIRKYWLKFSLCLLALNLLQPLQAATTGSLATISTVRSNTAPVIFEQTREQGRIAFLTARLLENFHYTHQLFDGSVSVRFFNEYLDALDPQRLHFLQSDLDDFEKYRTNLDTLTVEQSIADVSPAFVIFGRFMQRLEQRVNYVDDLLKHEKFTFDGTNRIVLDRRDRPYPKDLADAKKLWRERLRYEFLQEKISHIEAEHKKTNSVAEVTSSNAVALKAEKSATSDVAPVKTMDEEIADLLSHRYHRNLKLYQELDSDDVLERYLTSLAHAYDPHSDYMGKSTLESFAIQMNLALFGIGAQLKDADGYCTISMLMPGGPAIKSGKLAEGDRIVAVAQGDQPPVDVVDMSLNKTVQLIRGPKGTEVRLTVLPENSAERKVVSLIRDEIPLTDSAAKAKLVEVAGANGKKFRFGVIDLPSFYAPVDLGPGKAEDARYTSQDVALLLKKLKEEKVDGVILDLRRNGGGSLEEAIKLTGLFIKDGPVVQIRSGEGSVQVDEDTDSSITYDGPLMVLTSRFSASASEIVAAALQDYGRAIIVGDVSTHGKGTVQNVNPLEMFMRWRDSTNNPGALKVTIRKFYRASGASTQFKGVQPDIVLPSPFNYLKDIGEASLDNALPWDTIPSAKFEPANRVEPYLSELIGRSQRRVATNQDFVYVREDIEQLRKKQEDKTASLNEKDVLAEMDAQRARDAAREKERASRKPPEETDYEISLKQAALPGLPPPVGATNSVSSASLTTHLPDADSEDAEVSGDAKKTPPPDVDLVEGERIMEDYISLLSKNNVATAAAATTNN